MERVFIHFTPTEQTTEENAIRTIRELTNSLPDNEIVKGVFIDQPRYTTKLLDIFQNSLDEIDVIYTNFPFQTDEFLVQLIAELNRERTFSVYQY